MIWPLLLALAVWSGFFFVIHFGIAKKSRLFFEHLEIDEIDVIIAARNEAQNIADCLHSIANQKWLPPSCNVIIVDDSSSDGTVAAVKEVQHQFAQLKIQLLELPAGVGKKAAIKYALKHSKSPYKLQIDADGTLSANAIGQLTAPLYARTAAASFGEVRLHEENILQRLLALENLNNQCVSEAFMKFGVPLMANGAIMAFNAEAAGLYEASLARDIASGDDVFFVQVLRKERHKLSFIREAQFKTRPANSWFDFYHQRLRWASKTPKYSTVYSKMVAAFVWLVQCTFVLYLVFSPFLLGTVWVFGVWFVKWNVEYSFQKFWFGNRAAKLTLGDSLLLSLLYPFYVTIIGLASMLKLEYVWKGRTIT